MAGPRIVLEERKHRPISVLQLAAGVQPTRSGVRVKENPGHPRPFACRRGRWRCPAGSAWSWPPRLCGRSAPLPDRRV